MQDSIWDVADAIGTLAEDKEYVVKEFTSIVQYLGYLEQENDRLTKENKAMRTVIKIVKEA